MKNNSVSQKMRLTNKLIDFIIEKSWILVVVGLIVITVYIVLLYRDNYIIWKGKIDPEIFAKFGDFIGGLVGSIWALVGVLLLYKTLELQNEAKAVQDIILQNQQNELNNLQTQRELENFKSTFYSLLNLIDKAKSEFSFNNKVGVEGFRKFRQTAKEILNSNEDYSSMSSKIQMLYRVNDLGFSHFPLRLLFELLIILDAYPNAEVKSSYHKILASTFSTNEQIYIYNEVYSGYLLEHEIPSNFESIMWMNDKHKIFKMQTGQIKFNPNSVL